MKKFVYKNIFEFEEFKYKRPTTIDRFKGKVKDFFGVENKDHRAELERAIENLLNPSYQVYLSNGRKIGDNAIMISIAGKNIFVDKNPQDTKIRIGTKDLDVNDITEEAEYLYGVIERILERI